jgi:hypothetical protein
MPTPSDIVNQALDHSGDTLANLRARADRARDQERKDLEKKYDELFAEHRRLLFKKLKRLDKDPRIKEQISKLESFTLQLGAIKKEMTTVKKAIDGATRVINILGEIARIALKALA